MTASVDLISPVADAYQTIPRAAPLPSLAGQRVALIDSMLNPKSGWGQALLDGVERVLAPYGATFERERRKPLGRDPVDPWSDAMAARYRAAVIAVGD